MAKGDGLGGMSSGGGAGGSMMGMGQGNRSQLSPGANAGGMGNPGQLQANSPMGPSNGFMQMIMQMMQNPQFMQQLKGGAGNQMAPSGGSSSGGITGRGNMPNQGQKPIAGFNMGMQAPPAIRVNPNGGGLQTGGATGGWQNMNPSPIQRPSIPGLSPSAPMMGGMMGGGNTGIAGGMPNRGYAPVGFGGGGGGSFRPY